MRVARIAKKQAIKIKKKYSVLNKIYSLHVPPQYSLHVLHLGKENNLLVRLNYKRKTGLDTASRLHCQ